MNRQTLQDKVEKSTSDYAMQSKTEIRAASDRRQRGKERKQEENERD